ncbi:putative disease resistance protein RGA1 [Acorus gramineus]|uniref:Disease resistance protein RGA1 n=1 Tax=Acorus gramineus TaxID=55184 RepID=A0AAV9B922_ACOGR|nr:putative disease resistance protein RGA1 [Acorus gramineus]
MIIPSVVVKEITGKVTDLLKDEAFMLWGVNDRFTTLNHKLATISGVLQDAENKELKDVVIRRWLDELRDVMYDINDIIEDFNVYLHHHDDASSSNKRGFVSLITSAYNKCFEIVSEIIQCNFHRHDVGTRIDEINDRLERIHQDRAQFTLVPTVEGSALSRSMTMKTFRDRETVSTYIESEVFGIDEDSDCLVQSLSGPKAAAEGCRVIAVVGMGGIGKTTLAQKVYDKFNFQHKIWVCVSQNYNEIDVVKSVIQSEGGNHQLAQTKEELYKMMRDVLRGKQVLLVLDDMWGPEVWTKVLRVPFQSFTADTRVLITTRDVRVAKKVGAVYTHQVKVLPDEDAWSLLCKVASQGHINMEEIEELKEVGMEIVRRCKGLPLAIKAIGGVLINKDPIEGQWRSVLSDDLWSSSNDDTSQIKLLMSVLRLSYMDLPSYLKPCFLTYSLFPEDYEISRTHVIRMWVAEGFIKEAADVNGAQQMEDFAESYHNELVMRSLLQVVKVSVDPEDTDMKCKMHDLVRELAISMTHGEHIVGRERQQDSLKVRRLSILNVDEMEKIPKRVKNKKCRLRSLLVFQSKGMKTIPQNLYDNLKFLHILDLSNASFDHLPDSIGELVHLRYLNLYNTNIVQLPNSICNLRQVQTLILLESKHITKIPKGLSQMQEVRHLEVNCWVDIPEGIQELTNLQTLRDFTVRNRGGRCNIEELNTLNMLRYLVVQSFDKVPSATEASGAALGKKPHLKFLALKCALRVEGVRNKDEMRRIEEVLEQFQPHKYLETLFICDYYGRTLPTWMSMTPSPLEKLDHLELNGLSNLQWLPSLGNLPKLRVLRISHCTSIKTIGTEFVVDQEGAFPKLIFLSFNSMPRWEEWNGGERTDIFPRLKILELIRCPELKWIPGVFARPDIKVAMGHFSPLLLSEDEGKQYGNEFTGLFREMLRRS